MRNLSLCLGKVWSVEVDIPSDADVVYRYFIASIDPQHQECMYVRKWETHLKPRTILKGNEQQISDDVETFGVVNGVEKVDRGWLNNETILQFKFFNNPFNLKERMKNRLLFVKVSIVKKNGKNDHY